MDEALSALLGLVPFWCLVPLYLLLVSVRLPLLLVGWLLVLLRAAAVACCCCRSSACLSVCRVSDRFGSWDASAAAAFAVTVTRVGGPDEGVAATAKAPKRTGSAAGLDGFCLNSSCGCLPGGRGGGECAGEGSCREALPGPCMRTPFPIIACV